MNCTSSLAALSLCALAMVSSPVAAQGPVKPDLSRAKQIAETVCAACHGADGNSTLPVNPNLAGQGAEYISRQLQHFKAGIRVNPVMQGMVAALTPEEMVALGVYFSQQKPKPRTAKDAKLVEMAQTIYRSGDAANGLPACSACHSPNGVGVPKSFPRLAGQYSDYTLEQLKSFKAGERGNDKDGKDIQGRIMATIAQKMNDTQMKALSDYASGLR